MLTPEEDVGRLVLPVGGDVNGCTLFRKAIRPYSQKHSLLPLVHSPNSRDPAKGDVRRQAGEFSEQPRSLQCCLLDEQRIRSGLDEVSCS